MQSSACAIVLAFPNAAADVFCVLLALLSCTDWSVAGRAGSARAGHPVPICSVISPCRSAFSSSSWGVLVSIMSSLGVQEAAAQLDCIPLWQLASAGNNRCDYACSTLAIDGSQTA